MAQQIATWSIPQGMNLGVGAGDLLPQSTSFEAMGKIQGLPIAASGKLNFTPGAAFVVFAGYNLNSYFEISALLGYNRIGMNAFEGNISSPFFGTTSGSSKLNGHVDTILGFLNGVVSPLGQHHRFNPYFGGGIGFASSEADLQSITIAGNRLPIGNVSRTTNLALDVLIGADLKLTESAYIGVVYQCIRINSSSMGSGGGLSARTGVLYGHIVGAIFEYRF
jgi:opacity protein-like surface antigen